MTNKNLCDLYGTGPAVPWCQMYWQCDNSQMGCLRFRWVTSRVGLLRPGNDNWWFILEMQCRNRLEKGVLKRLFALVKYFTRNVSNEIHMHFLPPILPWFRDAGGLVRIPALVSNDAIRVEQLCQHDGPWRTRWRTADNDGRDAFTSLFQSDFSSYFLILGYSRSFRHFLGFPN